MLGLSISLCYRIDLYFHDYKIAIKIDENGHGNRNIDNEIKRQKAIKQKLGCEFIRIDFDKEDFDIFKAINERFRYIKQSSNQLTKQSTKKNLINKISMRLLGLEFKSDMMKSKATQQVIKKISPHFE